MPALERVKAAALAPSPPPATSAAASTGGALATVIVAVSLACCDVVSAEAVVETGSLVSVLAAEVVGFVVVTAEDVPVDDDADVGMSLAATAAAS